MTINTRPSHGLSLAMCLLSVALAGCANVAPAHIQGAQYWERINLRDSLYVDGKEKQESLDKDVSACVADLAKIKGDDEIRKAIPGGAKDGDDPDRAALADWDTPERDGHLLMEHSNYHDFEGCMGARGWKRVDFVPYPAVQNAEDTYLESRGITPEHKKLPEVESDASGESYLNF